LTFVLVGGRLLDSAATHQITKLIVFAKSKSQLKQCLQLTAKTICFSEKGTVSLFFAETMMGFPALWMSCLYLSLFSD
jgi:hypothetical protein